MLKRLGVELQRTALAREVDQTDQRQVIAEGRSIYLTKNLCLRALSLLQLRLPLYMSADDIKDVVEEFGEVEVAQNLAESCTYFPFPRQAVRSLPNNGISQACFVTMVSPGEAAFAVRGLNAQER